MMRIALTVIALVLTGAVLAGGLAAWWGVQAYKAPGPSAKDQIMIIERGAVLSAVAGKLEQAGVIEDAFLFRLAARVGPGAGALKAGEYFLPAGASMEDILHKLSTGDVYIRRFTVPEGRTSFEIVDILNRTEGLSGRIETIPAEGTLLPETYHFNYGDSRADKIARMRMAMAETLNRLWENRADNLPLESKEEALVLASIVEKETGLAGERAKVAGVFINRLGKGMKLQSDPTVIYALTEGKPDQGGKGPLGRRLLRKDMAFDSPYNTYMYTGLPPGPIANPGAESIAAVLNPARHDYLYFVADGRGGHAFAKTLREHNRNVAQWRKVRGQ